MKVYYQQKVIEVLSKEIYDLSNSEGRLKDEVFALKEQVKKLETDNEQLEQLVADHDKEIKNALNFCEGEVISD